MEVVYKAFDGKIFESEKECLAHEENIKIPKVVYYFDNSSHIPKTELEERDFMESAELIYIPKSQYDLFNRHMRHVIRPDGPGFYFWSSLASQWYSVEDIRKELKTLIDED